MSSHHRLQNQDRVQGQSQSHEYQGKDEYEEPSSKKRRHPLDHGNFQDYYHLRGHNAQSGSLQHRSSTRTELDTRVQLLLTALPATFHRLTAPRRILDLGCNQGRVGIQLVTSLPSISRLIGVDLDHTLKQRARIDAQSQGITSTPTPSSFPDKSTCRFFCADWMYPSQSAKLQGTDRALFDQENAEGYDLVLALSITKWIHIHDSDTGLLRFFQSLIQVLRPNGLLFFEPQPDRSYEQARRELSPELRRRARRLRLRMDDFVFLLVEIFGLQKIEMVTQEQQQNSFRPLYLFRKTVSTRRVLLENTSPVEQQVHSDETHLSLPFPWVSRNSIKHEQAAAKASSAPDMTLSTPGATNPLLMHPRSIKRRK